MRGRQPQRGEGWCPRGCEGSGQEWTRSFLDEAELVDPASPMADKNRAFPRNPLSPVFLRAQASLSSSKPPRAAGACFSRIFLKSIGHPPCICRVMPQGWGTHHPSAFTEAFALSGDSHPHQVTVTSWGRLLSRQMGLFCCDNIVPRVGLAGSFLALNYPGKFSL